MGACDAGTPSAISIYPRDFEAKEEIASIIEDYNRRMTQEGREESVIQYTDYVEIIMSSVNTIINAISYVLIAFVAISLVVSSIMIGIITYISVLERTKEIGILRAMGASKRDIANVFNAETLIVGFTAGMLGILVSALLTIPINILIKHLANISGVAQLPVAGAVILVVISMALTWIAGLIPSKSPPGRIPWWLCAPNKTQHKRRPENPQIFRSPVFWFFRKAAGNPFPRPRRWIRQNVPAIPL